MDRKDGTTMTKTYIENLIESLNKDKQKVDWTYFVDNFPNSDGYIIRAYDDLMEYNGVTWMKSFSKTTGTVQKIENYIKYIQSRNRNDETYVQQDHDNIKNLRHIQRKIIEAWIYTIISDYNFEKALSNATVDKNIEFINQKHLNTPTRTNDITDEYTELNHQNRKDD